MPTTEPDSAHSSAHSHQPAADDARLRVAVGILQRGDCLLMQRRLPGKPCAGRWEFPGGKIEVGESPSRALRRELSEELGIDAHSARRLMQLPFDYAHARVCLEVFVVESFTGEVAGCEGQQLKWLNRIEIARLDVIDAVPPILVALDGEATA